MTIAAQYRPKVARARAWAGRALAWWQGELAAAWRDAAARLGARDRAAVTIEAGEARWILRQRRRPIGQLDRRAAEPAADRAALVALIPEAARGRPVTVEIPPERVLAKIVLFPAGAQAELDRIVEFEIARHFPFPASRVFYRHRVVGHREAAGGAAEIAVEIVAVPRDVVAAIHAELAALGLRAGAVALATDGAAAPLPLPPAALAGAGAATRRAASPMLVLLVAALALAAAAAWPLAQHLRLAALDRELAALKPAAEAALQHRAQTASAGERGAALIRLRTARPPLVAVIDTLSREIPDGSWLLSLSISGREIVIDGLSPSAATLALALERDHAFTGIEFRAPITREANGLEHFRIAAAIAEAGR